MFRNALFGLSLAMVMLTSSVQAEPERVCSSLDHCIAVLFHQPFRAGIPVEAIKAAKEIQIRYAEAAIPQLISALADEDRYKVQRASYTLMDIDSLRSEHLPQLIASRMKGDTWILGAIARIGSEKAIRFIFSDFRQDICGIGHQVILDVPHMYALSILEKRTIPYLIELARSISRCTAESFNVLALVFRELGHVAAPAVTPLLEIALDKKRRVAERIGAVQCLAGLGSVASSVGPELKRMAASIIVLRIAPLSAPPAPVFASIARGTWRRPP